MITDLDRLRDVFEMAEMLNSEENNELELQLPDERNSKIATVIFTFNEDGELIEGRVEE